MDVVVLFLHLLGLAVLLGTGAGVAFFLASSHRTRNPHLIAHVAGSAVSFIPRSPTLGVVLPSNSPGVHALWVPTIALRIALVLKPAADLTDDDKRFLLANSFHAQRARMIEPSPRYAELLRKRDSGNGTALKNFTDADFRDLQVWSKLAWVDAKQAIRSAWNSVERVLPRDS